MNLKSGMLIGLVLTTIFFFLGMYNSVVTFNMVPHEFFYFFTVQTNLMVVVFFAFYNKLWMQKFRTTIMILIMVTMIVYNTLLRWSMPFDTMLSIVADTGLHIINPLLMLAAWIYTRKSSTESYMTNIMMTAYGVFYIVFIFAINYFVGFNIPYFFIDYHKFGWLSVSMYIVGLLIFFNILAFLVTYFENKRKNNSV